MPTKPSEKTINAAAKTVTPQAMMQAIMAETPELQTYNAAVTDDTKSLQDLGAYIMGLDVRRNAFITALVNRIGLTIVTSKLWNNPLARFRRGTLELGEVVEEIFVNVAEAHSFDPAGAESTFMRREIPDVRVAFHHMNFQKYYKVTVSDDQLRAAFVSWSELDALKAKIIESLYNAMNLDDWLVTKYMCAREMLNGGMYPVTVEDISANPKDAVTKFRAITNNMTFYKTEYNRARVRTHTEIPRQVIFIDTDVEASIGVEVLAAAFNLSQVDYLGQRILMDSFTFSADDQKRLDSLFESDASYKPFTSEEVTKLQSIVGFKVDEEWFMMFNNLEQMTQNYNGEGLYMNNWLHTWKTYSVSPFHNAAVFTTQTNAITGVTVTPPISNLPQGAEMVFVAKVSGTGLFDTSVKFAISGQTKSGTTIDPYTGRLHVAADEPLQTQITVTASSIDRKQAGTATVTVKND